MKILVFNVGSSSVKYSLFEDEKLLSKENIQSVYSKDQRENAVHRIVSNIDDVDIIAHRVVHGGKLTEPKLIDVRLIEHLKEVSELAPLHVTPELEVIEYCNDNFKAKQVAIFDTSFHTTMPNRAKIYGLPYKFFEEGIQKYGFHGISHEYVSDGVKGKVISCHIGSGCSITAIKDGESIDTSMGLTPLDGLLMSTRSGSLDPAIIPYLIEHHEASIETITRMLNEESGLLGISGISNDLRELLHSDDEKAKLAIEVFIYRIVKQIGAYIAAMDGVDSIIFTAGVTENNAYIRSRILENFNYIGVKVNEKKNKDDERIISTQDSKVEVLVIPTDEELAIAKKAAHITG